MSTDNLAASPSAAESNPVAGFALWAAKTTALWVTLVAAVVAASMLVPVSMPMGRPDGPFAAGQPLLVVSALDAIALALVAARARVAGWRLALMLFVAYFAIGSAMLQIETLWFNDSLKLPLVVVGQLVADAAIVAVIVGIAGALLFHPAREAMGAVPAGLAWRVAAMALIYVVLYYGAGFFIAWQSAAVRAYYDNGAHIALIPTVLFQILRGTLWALIALFIVSRLRGSLASRALIMGVLFAVITAAQLLYPAPFFPWAVRQAHLMEVGSSEFVYGIIVTMVLLAGATRRPLASTSAWRAVTGNA
jgi:hypothetical protein